MTIHLMRGAALGALLIALAACQTPAPDVVAQIAPPVPAAAAPLPASMDTSDPTQNLSVVQIAPGLRYVIGRNVSSNTYVVDTSEGAVIVDTSRPPASRAHHDLLVADGVTKVAYIILTHGHGDHTGGVALWKQGGAKVIAQQNFGEFLEYQRMLSGFFASRNGAQFQFAGGAGASAQRVAGAQAVAAAANRIKPDITFDDKLSLDVGDTHFELLHTPGETPDHLSVWVPKLNAVFVGDNFYESFPNMYTLRGTRPRWALDYIHSIETVMALEPEIMLPSHGPAVVGKDEVHRQLKKYHDAIVYVHDAVVAGMNAGKDVHTLMQEIHLPPELDVGEGYGKIAWSVRGIYEGYAGWFNGDPAEMFPVGRESVSANLVKLAGGPKKVADEAMRLLATGKAVEALNLTSIGLEGAPGDKDVLRARAAALDWLSKASTNRNEKGWLDEGLVKAKTALGE
jgi:alkyl sulfatase BDS1-like metallo-beta-lactamase superfamily hydrolase